MPAPRQRVRIQDLYDPYRPARCSTISPCPKGWRIGVTRQTGVNGTDFRFADGTADAQAALLGVHDHIDRAPAFCRRQSTFEVATEGATSQIGEHVDEDRPEQADQ